MQISLTKQQYNKRGLGEPTFENYQFLMYHNAFLGYPKGKFSQRGLVILN